MNQQHKHDHNGHGHHEHHPAKSKALHKDWRAWVVIGLMLAAMAAYVLSDDERLQPGQPLGEEMPAAPAAE